MRRLTFRDGHSEVPAESQSEEALEGLLLELSRNVLDSNDPDQLLLSFCQLTRAFFRADGAYFWNYASEGELVGVVADGHQASGFPGMHLRAGDPSIAMQAVQQRRSLVENQIALARYPMLSDSEARAALAAPLLIRGEVLGAIGFVHTSVGATFGAPAVAQVTILAAQLSAAIEAVRLNQAFSDERRRASVLIEVATEIHGLPDASSVMEIIADRLRDLLQSPAVLIFMQHENLFQLQAVSAENPRIAQEIRMRAHENNLRSPLEIATRAVTSGKRITVNIDGASHLGEGAPPGTLIAVPFRTSHSHGAILVYPRRLEAFTEEDKTLVSTLAHFSAVAIANAELYGISRTQAQELHQLLAISSVLGSAGKLDEFMLASVVHATNFLGFQRCFVGVLEGPAFHIRWGFENGRARQVEIALPDGVSSRKLKQKDVFVAEDASKIPGADLDFVAAFGIKQLLAVPLVGSNGDVLGMFGVLDSVELTHISEEDVRRARAVAAQIAIALELTRNLQQAEEHRRRSEVLIALALELNTVLHLPDFMRQFALRAASLFGGRCVALTLFGTPEVETVLMCNSSEVEDKQLVRSFAQALRAALPKYTSDVAFAAASELLGAPLASTLAWLDCTVVRLNGSAGELIGVLCIADRGAAPSPADHQLLRAVAGHASVAIENARLFTRLQQANRHWLEVFNAINDFIVVHDEQNNVLRVNRSLAELVGIEPDQLVGVNMRALDVLSTAASPHSCPFCRSGEGLDQYVHSALERTYLISTSRIHADSSTQLQTVHVLKDISDLREAERRYRELFDNIEEGIYVSTPQGRFVEVNDALVRILGYDSREEVLRLDIPSEVYFSQQRRLELAEQLRQKGEMHNQEEVLRRKDGSAVHVYMNCYAMRDVAGNVLQHRGLMLDISNLRQSQTELQRERDFSDKILNHTQSLILVTDTDGVISYANRRWSGLGFQQGHIVGHALVDLCAASRRDALRQALNSVAHGQQVDNFDLPLVRGDGASGQFSVNLSPISNEDGNVTSIVVVMTDVTDSAMLRSKLVHAEKMVAVGQLVSGVAHEVNNPLTAILGFTDLLMENPDLPESARRDLRVILQEAQRTKQIVQNLLSFARQMPPRRQPVQLNSILHRTVQLRSYDFISHGIQVLERLDESLPEIVGDSHQLQQVFLNIINNAYDAVRECGHPARIEIMSARSSGYVEVSFRDNGTGISDPDRIFDPFFTTKDIGKGTGLGLSICYGIVREHGGEIICHNNLDSEGATFIVRLPLAADAASFGAAAGVNPQ